MAWKIQKLTVLGLHKNGVEGIMVWGMASRTLSIYASLKNCYCLTIHTRHLWKIIPSKICVDSLGVVQFIFPT